MPIRLATLDDAHGIATVHVLAWQTAYVGIVPDHVLDNLSIEKRTERWQEILSDEENKSTTWVYQENNQILGWCSIGPNRDEDAEIQSGELWAMYVLPTAQRKGVGSALMQTAVSGLRQQHYEMATLWVLTENHTARKFYEATGWKETRATKVVEMGGKALSETRYKTDLAFSDYELALAQYFVENPDSVNGVDPLRINLALIFQVFAKGKRRRGSIGLPPV